MDMTISWLAVFAATVVGMVIAFIWYSDWGLVGETWRKLTGVTKEVSAGAGKGPMVVLVVSVVLTAIGLAAIDSLAAGFFDSDSHGSVSRSGRRRGRASRSRRWRSTTASR